MEQPLDPHHSRVGEGLIVGVWSILAPLGSGDVLLTKKISVYLSYVAPRFKQGVS